MATAVVVAVVLAACGGAKKSGGSGADSVAAVAVPEFCADSAYAFCAAQCAFGPRVMNSEAHEQCGAWIAGKFSAYGMAVSEQRVTLRGYDGTPLRACNIIASMNPGATDRVLLCAHWDSRPWADNDPDSANWRKPVMAANDGASGVAVLLELARLLEPLADSMSIGVDFVCFDAEDWGTPQWAETGTDADTWALGAHHWAAHPHKAGYKARFGILLDMVGGQGARFYREGMSMRYASEVVDRVWQAASEMGYGSYFPASDGGMITDDHIPVNEVAGIPTIDIIPYYPDCAQSSFGPTWHTVADDMAHIDKATLKAVGQTVMRVLVAL